VRFRGQGTLVIGPGVMLGDPDAGRPGVPILLAPRHDRAQILIGAQTRLTNGVELHSLDRIELGVGCLIGSGVRIMDADFHGVNPDQRRESGRSAAVTIGDHVWIGMSAIVLKGVRIGVEAVVGAGAVVVKDVPAGAVVAGNPARIVASVHKGASVATSQ
jgi:acetyltransferase-like isoleucine patch superfamily enzyme